LLIELIGLIEFNEFIELMVHRKLKPDNNYIMVYGKRHSAQGDKQNSSKMKDESSKENLRYVPFGLYMKFCLHVYA
jgi:hypothetical protein